MFEKRWLKLVSMRLDDYHGRVQAHQMETNNEINASHFNVAVPV
jgi:hypothetical protein